MPTRAEIDIFVDKILVPVGHLSPSQLPPQVVGFFARKGDAYDGKLMIVGRAVNGFTIPAKPESLRDETVARAFASELNQEIIDLDCCPLTWVRDGWGATEGYNTKKSAFWRVARRTLIDLDIASETMPNWASHLVWSNLYKVAPDGGNPSQRVCAAQELGCIDLLREEIRIYQPKRLLFMTGLWATPFLKALNWKQAEDRGTETNVHLVGALGDSRVVVATHPMGKAEKPWIHEVVEAFNANI